MAKMKGRVRAYGAALLAVTLWGASFVATKAALAELSPVSLVFTRFSLGAAVLVGLLAVKRELALPPRAMWRALAAMGFVGIFVHQALQVYGLSTTTATNAGWLIALIPAWSALLAVLFLGERLKPAQVAGLAIGFGGALVVVGSGAGLDSVIRLDTSLGDLLILVSTLNWAVYTVISRKALQTLGSARATAASGALGLAMLLPFFLVQAGWREYPNVTPSGWLAVLFLGIGCSGMAYLCWYYALSRLGASRVASFLYLEPLVTLGAAWAVLHERLEAATLIGGILILAGVVLVQGTGPTRPQVEDTRASNSSPGQPE